MLWVEHWRKKPHSVIDYEVVPEWGSEHGSAPADKANYLVLIIYHRLP